MAIQEVTAWATVTGDNIAHHPTGPQGNDAVRISTSFRELQAAIARWRDTLGGGATPGGANTNIQFNDSGAFGGSASLAWTGTSLAVDGDIEILDGLGNLYIREATPNVNRWVEWENTGYSADQRRWRMGTFFSSLQIAAVDDDNSLRPMLTFAKNAISRTQIDMVANTFVCQDDGAGSTTFEIQHDVLRLGDAVAGTGCDILQDANNQEIFIGGGSSTSSGARLTLAGPNASAANRIQLLASLAIPFSYNENTGYAAMTLGAGKGTRRDMRLSMDGNFFRGLSDGTQDFLRFTHTAGTELWEFGIGGSNTAFLAMDESKIEQLKGDLVLTEKADHSVVTPAATKGYIWLRNDTPNVLVFTDDAGTDHDISAGGSVTRNTPFGIIGTATGATNVSLLEIRDSADSAVQMRVGQNINGSNVSDVINTMSNGSVRIGTDNGSATGAVDFLAANTPVANMSTTYLRLNDDLDLMLQEKAVHAATTTNGWGQLWCRNDVPNTLIYTDGAGTDFPISPRAPVALANSATPAVTGERLWLTGGTTTITDFTGGYTGQEIIILSEHAITITDGTNIFLAGSANFTMANTDSLHLVQKADGNWYEISRSVN